MQNITPKQIHDALLSLFVRGLGIWLLYLAVENVITFYGDIIDLISPPRPGDQNHWGWDFSWLFLHLVLAAYFVLGAPPFLRWATSSRPGQ